MRKVLASLLLLVMAPVFIGCPNETTENPTDNLDRKAALKAVAEDAIIPALSAVTDAVGRLDQAINTPDGLNDEGTVVSAQHAFVEAAFAWKRMEFYHLGKLDEDRDSLIHKIDYGAGDPMLRTQSVDSMALENAITSGSSISVAYVESKPATLQGFPVIEQMLYGGGQIEVVKAFIGPNGAKRLGYIRALVKSLHNRLNSVLTDWQPTGGNYVESFSSDAGNDVGSNFSMLVNDIVFFVESARNEKVGRPLGKRTAGAIQPDKVEARPSGYSIPFLVMNLNGLKAAIGGSNKGKPSIASMLDQLDAKLGDKKLSEVILAQIDIAIEDANAIPATLSDAVVTNKPEVEQLYADLNKLLGLMKSDMMGQFGIMATWTDNDGD